jgi:hypothetical protein
MPIVKIKKDASIKPFSSLDILLDKKVIGGALLECLEKDDDKSLLQIVKDYVRRKKEHGPQKQKTQRIKAVVPAVKSKKVPKKPATVTYPTSVEKRAQKRKS